MALFLVKPITAIIITTTTNTTNTQDSHKKYNFSFLYQQIFSYKIERVVSGTGNQENFAWSDGVLSPRLCTLERSTCPHMSVMSP